MPRGPGKKENYNLDYSRFNKFDRLGGDGDEADAATPPEADKAGGLPPMQDLVKGMPRELQEAYHLMQVGRQTGNPEAQKRANELAIKAVQNGGPEVKRDFLKNVGQMMPQVADRLGNDLALGGTEGGPSLDAASILDDVAERVGQSGGSDLDAGNSLKTLKEQMKKGQEATRQELENLQKQQAQLENIRSPEEFVKVMLENGTSAEDLERIMGGDEAFLETHCRQMLQKSAVLGPDGKLADAEEAIKAAEELHDTLVHGKTLAKNESSTRAVVQASAPASQSALSRAPPPTKAEPEVKIPPYRLQYQKDANGRFTVVELRCTLPGVADMSAITLDVSEKHLRLTTELPAPRYAVNAGPFPVLIDPAAARAKYSRKKEELHIAVPTKDV